MSFSQSLDTPIPTISAPPISVHTCVGILVEATEVTLPREWVMYPIQIWPPDEGHRPVFIHRTAGWRGPPVIAGFYA